MRGYIRRRWGEAAAEVCAPQSGVIPTCASFAFGVLVGEGLFVKRGFESARQPGQLRFRLSARKFRGA